MLVGDKLMHRLAPARTSQTPTDPDLQFMATRNSTHQAVESDEVFELAAEVFRVMSAPMRLKIIASLCNGERNVSELLSEIDTTQPNMSQHLNTLYQAGVLGKRREGVQIYYRIVNDRVVTLCRAVCTQIAIESDAGR